MKLEIELVPSTSWYTNVRSNVSTAEWDKIRRETYKKAGYKCEICSEKGTEQGFKWPVECHEIWEYQEAVVNEETTTIENIQKLKKFVALCPLCHKVKHIGLAQIQGHYQTALQHMIKVNKITATEAQNYVDKVFEIWRERSCDDWKVDLTLINK